MQICQLTIQACGDINEYVMQVEDLIQLLGPYPTDELLPDLFQQFKTVPCHYFNKAIVNLEQDYYLGRHSDLTCLMLCATVTEIKRIQEQACQWDAPSPDDPTILALCSTIAHQNTALLAQQEALEALTATNWHHPHQDKHGHNSHLDHHPNFPGLPKWVREKPTDPDETHQFNRQTWYYCGKCCRGKGAWNVMHKMESHINRFLSDPSNQSSDTYQANLGLRRTNSTDSNDSNHSRKHSVISFDNDTNFCDKNHTGMTTAV